MPKPVIDGFEFAYSDSKVSQCTAHCVPFYEVYFLTSGTSNYFINDCLYPCTSGTLVIVPPDILHWNHYTSDKYSRYVLNFPSSYITDELRNTINPDNTPEILYIPDTTPILSIFKKMWREWDIRDEYSPSVIRGLVNEFFVHIARHKGTYLKRNIDTVHPTVNKITQYISENYHEPLTLELIADKFRLNPNYLSTLFKSCMGFGLKKYITIIRIERAREMLLNSDLSVSQIAFKCGFNDSNYFSQVFRSTVNDTPLHFRNTHLNSN
ncbi:MAG: helix-turn-helix transcriptional regulator [Clostridia bacterium]|nr:helix-turn-helix transcriptional regulator [Clostridia bacterium]